MTRPERADTLADSIAASEPTGDPVIHDGGHVFDGERCAYCNVNTYDIGIYPDAPEVCPVPHEPMRYTTETPSKETGS